MTDPIVSSNDPSKVEALGEGPYVDPSYNPLLAAMLASDVSVSLAQSNLGVTESGCPKLEPPSSEEVFRKMTLQWSKIMSSILDRWGDDNEKMEEIRKENIKKADKKHSQFKLEKVLKEKVAKQLDRNTGAVDPLTTRDIWQNGMASLFALYAHEAQKTKGVDAATSGVISGVGAPSGTGNAYVGDLGGVQPSSAMTSALIIAAGFVGSFKTAEVSGAPQVDNKVLQEAWNQIAVGHNANDPATQVAGWLSALWGVGLTYFTAAQQVGEITVANKEPPKDLEFAVKYAENLLAGLATPQFATQLRAIVVANTKPGEQVDTQQVAKLCNLGKIILLTVALAQIMKLEVGASFKDKTYQGHITGEEVVAMLNGKLDFQKNDPQGLAPTKAKLLAQINVLMDNLPADTRAALIANMKGYFNTNPSVEKLSDINSVIGTIFSSSNIEERHMEQNPM